MLFTTSWDDGYTLDLQLADTLATYGCKGTFYVCPEAQHDQTMLSDEGIRTLHKRGFEIGAHTITHPRLTAVDDERARYEIVESKARIERITEAECTMFCYPKGAQNARVRAFVKEAGYRGARTVEQLRFTAGEDPFGMPTSLHVYSFPWRRSWHRWWHFFDPVGPLRVKNPRLRELQTPMRAKRNWLQLAKYLFTYALEHREPVFHLWGHSEEVRRLRMWDDLTEFLAFVASHREIEHRTNGQMAAQFFSTKG